MGGKSLTTSTHLTSRTTLTIAKYLSGIKKSGETQIGRVLLR